MSRETSFNYELGPAGIHNHSYWLLETGDLLPLRIKIPALAQQPETTIVLSSDSGVWRMIEWAIAVKRGGGSVEGHVVELTTSKDSEAVKSALDLAGGKHRRTRRPAISP